MNDLAAQVLYKDKHKQPLGEAPFDYETNGDNYNENGALKKGCKLQPAFTTIYKGMRVRLTRNLDKKQDFVNGMDATIDHYDSQSKCIEVITRTKKRLSVHLVTDIVEGHGRVTCFPIRIGYACTIPKIQGTTLPHVTIWMDRAGCRAAAYVAMSRVAYDKQYQFGGDVCPRHFVPAM